MGVFGTDKASKTAFENSIAKKSETEGLIVYQRIEGGKRFTFLDDSSFPEKIQGYARIASLSDYSFYLLPTGPNLSPSDGELAILLGASGLEGTLVEFKGTTFSSYQSAFRGLTLAEFPVEKRNTESSVIDLSRVGTRTKGPEPGTLVYLDRTFNVKGVGLVALGFVLSGAIAIHDKLRLIPGQSQKMAEVKGIQVNDVEFESVGRGLRVGLLLRNVELDDLSKTSWLDDGSFALTSKLSFEFTKSRYYKQEVCGRELHLECEGELFVARISEGPTGKFTANLQSEVPIWSGMRVIMVDLNGGALRVAGGGKVIA